MDMTRKAAEFWWNLPLRGVKRKPFIVAPDVAYYTRNNAYEKWDTVTWSDVHKKRTEMIGKKVHFKRLHAVLKPCLLWVFSNEGRFPFGGYYTMIKTLRKEYYLNFRSEGLLYGSKNKLQLKAMQCFPLCLPMPELFQEWMEMFCEKYHKTNFYHKRKTQGVSKCWCIIDQHGYLSDIAISSNSLN